MPSTLPKAKNWCFTQNNIHDKPVFSDSMQYLVFGKEVAPSTGRLHWQGYVQFRTQQRLSAVKKMFVGAHLEIQRGSAEEASNYCKKDGEFEEFGEISLNANDRRSRSREDICSQIADLHVSRRRSTAELKRDFHPDFQLVIYSDSLLSE